MLGMDRIYRIPQFGARVGRSAHPLRVMDRNGTFPARGTATGQRYHTEADALRFLSGGDVAPAGFDRGLLPGVRPGQQDDRKRPVSAVKRTARVQAWPWTNGCRKSGAACIASARCSCR